MKKCVKLFFIVCLLFVLTACTVGDTGGTQSRSPTESSTQTQNIIPTATPYQTASHTPEPDATQAPPFEGKIGIITYSNMTTSDEDSARVVVKKYGEDKVVHVTWPNSWLDYEMTIDTITGLGADPDIKAIIMKQVLPGTNAAVDKLKETRNDIFIVYMIPQEDPIDMVQRADIILEIDDLGMGPATVRQAEKLGAKTFVHYSFPRHMSTFIYSSSRELMKQECNKLGIKFVDANIPDPNGDAGFDGTQKFILSDVPRLVDEYGKETAFFTTEELARRSLLKAVINASAICPLICNPDNDYVAFLASSLELDIGPYYDPVSNEELIAKEREILAEKNMLGRISTWPVRDSMALTDASAEYAIKWINGEVPKEGVDVEVLKQLMEDYAGVEVYLTPYTDGYYTDRFNDAYEGTGETYDNFLMMRMDYLTFE